MFELEGIYTPIATPFADGKIAYDKLEKNLDFWLSSKLTGIVVMGSNGEFVGLHESEKDDLTRFCCTYIKGRKKIIIGTGSNCIDETHHLNKLAAECGADAVLVITPFYYKNGMKDNILEQYFTEVADRSPLPVVLYNMPGNTGVNMSATLLVKLSKHSNIIGVKDTSGNIVQISETINMAAPSFSVFAGNWAFLLPSLLMGAKGATLALGNIAPNECSELLGLVQQGRLDEARTLAFRLMPVNAAITTKYGIGGLKVAMDLVGLYGGEPRSPLRQPGKEACEEIAQTLRSAGLC
nr:dihydrodipicolinate synthase family protein [uncultured Fretibacterium sp.]